MEFIKTFSLCNKFVIKVNWYVHSIFIIKRNFSKKKTKSPSLNYCLNLVKNRDYENYLCTLLLPGHLQVPGIAFRAFNVEIASIEDNVSNNLAGQMRFKFWEDAIDKIFEKKVPKHPVCVQLSKVVSKHKLSKMYLKRLVSSRSNNLMASFETLQSVENYAEHSNSTLYYLLLECAGCIKVKNINADHAASHLGKAFGLINLLRGTIYFASKNKIILPQDILLKHNVSHELILRGKNDQNVKDLIFEISSRAHTHLQKTKQIFKNVPKESRLIYLSSVCAELYLKQLQLVDFNVFDPQLQFKNGWLPLKLYWKSFFY